MMEGTIMTAEQRAGTAPPASVEPLEEIARRLVKIHISLASNLDGGRKLQNWTREQIEDLMVYVDNAIDSQAEAVQ